MFKKDFPIALGKLMYSFFEGPQSVFQAKRMVANFCHHLSDNYTDFSYLYVYLSVIYIMSTFQISISTCPKKPTNQKTWLLNIMFYSVFMTLTVIYLSTLYLTRRNYF